MNSEEKRGPATKNIVRFALLWTRLAPFFGFYLAHQPQLTEGASATAMHHSQFVNN